MALDTVSQWHALVARRDPDALDDLLADDVVFHSPIVHTPQRGKALTRLYLTAAFHVLVENEFRYVREVVGERDAVLEFTATVDGIHVNGVDMIHWNAEGRIDDFKVMLRPLKAVNLLHSLMRSMLDQLAASSA
ncbi:MAG: nuclear transport factor 2 family protein [bacterium]